MNLDKNKPLKLNFGKNVFEEPCLYFSIDDMAIYDPFQSSCGRFEVWPETEYGIPDDVAMCLTGLNAYFKRGEIVWEDER